MIHLDSSILIDALTGPRRSAPQLRQLIERGERIRLSAIVVFEWRHGPRTAGELEDQEALFPTEDSVAFGSGEALIASDTYRSVPRSRGREIDIAIAACAIAHDAELWTMNGRDFHDIPKLKLLASRSPSEPG